MMLRAVLVVLALAFAQDAAAQDKPVSVVDTDPMPVSIEAGTFFLFGGQVTLSVRNRHTAPVIATLNNAIQKAMGDEEFLKDLRTATVEPITDSTPARTKAFIDGELRKWAELVKSTGIKLN